MCLLYSNFDLASIDGKSAFPWHGNRLASVPGLPRYVRVLICGGGDNAVKTGKLTDHVMGMRRGPSLEPRRKLGASYGKETRNGGPYNVSACDGPRGHTHVRHRRSVTLALSPYFWSPCLRYPYPPRVYRHVISQPTYHLPRKSKRARNGEGLGPRPRHPYIESLPTL